SSLSKDREELEELLGRKEARERKKGVNLNTCPKIRRPVDDKCINFVIYEADESTLLLMKSYKIVDSKLRGFWSPIWMWSYLER
ncbi:hypothetical protein EBU71_21840, partial [bacterium]|nr:hypothetical protein [Candidatus Elulimicrobium humile]